ncbi:MAG: hypothetical protein JJW01_03550 [Alphaproteobacteria bacterium]|nr:hypothetical protein [Rickettsiales bacterium]
MILVAFGSESGEEKISFASAKFVESQLNELNIKDFTLAQLSYQNFVDVIEKHNPKCVFNAMHGSFGEDGEVQKLLNFYKIPYTHSHEVASFLGIRKSITKSILSKKGINFAKGITFSLQELLDISFIKKIEEEIESKKIQGSRFVIKPEGMGSSLHLFELNLNDKASALTEVEAIKKNLCSKQLQLFIAEEMIIGKEFDVVVFDALDGDPIVDVAEIKCGSGSLYTYDTKYHLSKSVVDFKPKISKKLKEKLCEYGLQMHKELGCKDVSRSEFIVREQGDDFEIFALEINTHPGLRDVSCAVNIPKLHGVSPKHFIKNMLNRASYTKI